MGNKLDEFYPHRRNRDGSFDSICLICLATVAAGKSELDLVELEKVHVCNLAFLADRRGFIYRPTHAGPPTKISRPFPHWARL